MTPTHAFFTVHRDLPREGPRADTAAELQAHFIEAARGQIAFSLPEARSA